MYKVTQCEELRVSSVCFWICLSCLTVFVINQCFFPQLKFIERHELIDPTTHAINSQAFRDAMIAFFFSKTSKLQNTKKEKRDYEITLSLHKTLTTNNSHASIY